MMIMFMVMMMMLMMMLNCYADYLYNDETS